MLHRLVGKGPNLGQSGTLQQPRMAQPQLERNWDGPAPVDKDLA